MRYHSEEDLRVLGKALLTSTIPMVRWHVSEMATIGWSVGTARTVEKYW